MCGISGMYCSGDVTIALTQRYAHLSKAYLKAGVELIGAPRTDRSHPVDTKRLSS